MDKYDTQRMYKIYDKWPQIAQESYDANLDSVDFNDIDHIVFTGMGGSGTLGDIFSAILSKTNIHVNVVKGYLLPKTVDSDTLIVVTSVSGNTVESLTVLDSAKKLECSVVTFSSGGKIQDYCAKNKIEYRKIPQYNSPRASFTAYLYSMLKVLKPLLPVKENDVKESISKLKYLTEEICSSKLDQNNISLELAKWISGIPLIYFPWGLQATAVRFKNSLAENSKLHAMIEDVIETSHNGIVSWEKTSNVQPILLQGKDDHIKTEERWKIIKEFFKSKKIEYFEIMSPEGSILTKLICLIYLLDYSSIYLAIKNGIDPTPIKPTDFIKHRL